MNGGDAEASNAFAWLVLHTAYDVADAAAAETDPRRRANAYRDALRLLRHARHLFDFPHDGDADALLDWLDHDRRRANVAASVTLLTKQRDELLGELFALETAMRAPGAATLGDHHARP